MLPSLEAIKGIHPGYILKRELKRRGLKSSELASNINEHKQTISAVINCKRKVTPTLSIKLANVFGVSQDYFMLLQASYEVKAIASIENFSAKPDIKKFRKILFWDTDINLIDWEKQKKSVIIRVLERGNEEEINELISFYGRRNLSSEIKKIDRDTLPSFQMNVLKYKL